jgi:hypothetical protein
MVDNDEGDSRLACGSGEDKNNSDAWVICCFLLNLATLSISRKHAAAVMISR